MGARSQSASGTGPCSPSTHLYFTSIDIFLLDNKHTNDIMYLYIKYIKSEGGESWKLSSVIMQTNRYMSK